MAMTEIERKSQDYRNQVKTALSEKHSVSSTEFYMQMEKVMGVKTNWIDPSNSKSSKRKQAG
jgi:hypothetical protein